MVYGFYLSSTEKGIMHYNYTIIDVYDRFAVATLNGKHITTELAIETLKISLKRHKPGKGLILHSDQGSQFTSKVFNDFCKKNYVQQSMSRTGCPYDNSPMERFYTLVLQFCSTRTLKISSLLDSAIVIILYF